MGTELTTKSVDTSTYQLRRRMLSRLAQAQELEHKFLAEYGDVFREASTPLMDDHSALILNECTRLGYTIESPSQP